MEIVYLVCNRDELELPIGCFLTVVSVAKAIGYNPHTLYNLIYSCNKNFWVLKKFVIYRLCI